MAQNYLPAFIFLGKLTQSFNRRMVDLLKSWLGNNKIEGPKLMSEETIIALDSPSAGNEYCHRVLDSASLILRVTRSLDHRLQGNSDVDNFFSILSKIEQCVFTSKSFEGKTVIVVEGLECSGKTLIANKVSKLSNGVVISANNIAALNRVRHIFQSLPSPVEKAFEFVVNYFIAYEIVNNKVDNLFIVDQFHHAVCVRNICEKVTSVDDVSGISRSAFEWPFDLPLPELVLFLAVPTELRLQRLEADTRPYNTKIASTAALKDAKENLVYSMICGPTTVGIDGSGSIDDAINIIYDALDYYGANISRNILPSPENNKRLSSRSTSSAEEGDCGGGADDAAHHAHPKKNRRISVGVYGMFSKM